MGRLFKIHKGLWPPDHQLAGLSSLTFPFSKYSATILTACHYRYPTPTGEQNTEYRSHHISRSTIHFSIFLKLSSPTAPYNSSVVNNECCMQEIFSAVMASSKETKTPSTFSPSLQRESYPKLLLLHNNPITVLPRHPCSPLPLMPTISVSWTLRSAPSISSWLHAAHLPNHCLQLYLSLEHPLCSHTMMSSLHNLLCLPINSFLPITPHSDLISNAGEFSNNQP